MFRTPRIVKTEALAPRVVVMRLVAALLRAHREKRRDIDNHIDVLLAYLLETFQDRVTTQQAREMVFSSFAGSAPSKVLPLSEASLRSIPNNLIPIMVVRAVMRHGINMPKSEIWKYFLVRYLDVLQSA